MKQEFRKWDKNMIIFKTNSNQIKVKELRKRLQNYDNDDLKDVRLRKYECKVCTYISSNMAFQAFTNTLCRICGKEMIFSSSDTDNLCVECAKENNLCKHCGGELD
jgi:hypothetical protein